MKFTLKHSRDVIGQRIAVTIVVGPKQTIASVRTVLDRRTIGNDSHPIRCSFGDTQDEFSGMSSP